MTWNIIKTSKTQIVNPILIEGLPGMGNVGKIAVDFLIDSLKAKKIMEITSYQLPHCVFVNEDNLVELPEIEIYHKKLNGNSILLLAGDIQPLNEQSCYEFCHAILDSLEKENGKEIITLGGVALPSIPEKPKVYCTGNSKKLINKYKKSKAVNTNLNEVVGPIIGVSGLLTGLAGKINIPAVSLLAETFAHPDYLGVKGAKELLKVIQKRLNLKLNLKELDEEIADLETNLKSRRIKHILKTKEQPTSLDEETDYIG